MAWYTIYTSICQWCLVNGNGEVASRNLAAQKATYKHLHARTCVCTYVCMVCLRVLATCGTATMGLHAPLLVLLSLASGCWLLAATDLRQAVDSRCGCAAYVLPTFLFWSTFRLRADFIWYLLPFAPFLLAARFYATNEKLCKVWNKTKMKRKTPQHT